MLGKKLKIIIPIVIVLLIIIIIVILKFNNNSSYVITVSKIDDQSPARMLKVYKDGKGIDFKEIRYKDDIFLCTNLNPTVFYGDVEKEKELKLILNDNKYIMAKVKEE